MRKMSIAIPLAAVGLLLATGVANAATPKAKLKLACSVPAAGFKLAGDRIGVVNPSVVCMLGKTKLTPQRTPAVFKFFWKGSVSDFSGNACPTLSGLSQKPVWVSQNPLNGKPVALPVLKAVMTVIARYGGQAAKATGRGVVTNPAARVICNVPPVITPTADPSTYPACNLAITFTFDGLVAKSGPLACKGGDGVCSSQIIEGGARQAQQYLTLDPSMVICKWGTREYRTLLHGSVQFSRDGVTPSCRGAFDRLTTFRVDDARSWGPGWIRVGFDIYNIDTPEYYASQGPWNGSWVKVNGSTDPCLNGALPLPPPTG